MFKIYLIYFFKKKLNFHEQFIISIIIFVSYT
jgi:hypothetical protein